MNGLSLTFECEPEKLAYLRKVLRGWLGMHSVDEELVRTIVLATHEAAADAIGHAAPCEHVDIEGAVEHDRIVIDITDTGREHFEPLVGVDEQHEQRRSLIVLRHLVDRVEVSAHPSGTTVRISQTISDGSAQQE
jgi:anti-sigma regulatory factor (Ser/Thr protein kinase)